MKICKKCGETKNESEYGKRITTKDGLNSWCKACLKDYNQKWYKNNSEKVKEAAKQRYKNNPDYFTEWHTNNPDYKQEWRTNNPDYFTEWRQNNPDYHKKYQNNRLKTDPNFKLSINLRNRIRLAVKSQYGDKAHSSIELLGCTIEQCRMHLESLFQPGMTWENYGLHGWHIDHIIPCDAFDLTDPEQQKQCFHYTNLRPLWATDNLKKSNKIIS